MKYLQQISSVIKLQGQNKVERKLTNTNEFMRHVKYSQMFASGIKQAIELK